MIHYILNILIIKKWRKWQIISSGKTKSLLKLNWKNAFLNTIKCTVLYKALFTLKLFQNAQYYIKRYLHLSFFIYSTKWGSRWWYCFNSSCLIRDIKCRSRISRQKIHCSNLPWNSGFCWVSCYWSTNVSLLLCYKFYWYASQTGSDLFFPPS